MGFDSVVDKRRDVGMVRRVGDGRMEKAEAVLARLANRNHPATITEVGRNMLAVVVGEVAEESIGYEDGGTTTTEPRFLGLVSYTRTFRVDGQHSSVSLTFQHSILQRGSEKMCDSSNTSEVRSGRNPEECFRDGHSPSQQHSELPAVLSRLVVSH